VLIVLLALALENDAVRGTKDVPVKRKKEYVKEKKNNDRTLPVSGRLDECSVLGDSRLSATELPFPKI
jgi:hypothetical protein